MKFFFRTPSLFPVCITLSGDEWLRKKVHWSISRRCDQFEKKGNRVLVRNV